MSITDELQRLQNTDLAISQRLAQRLRASLNSARDPELLSELIDFQFQTNSKPALRILTGLKDIHSQDFFAKLHESLLKNHTRLQSLLLIAHLLKGQASWLYKTVDSPVFGVLLQFLRLSDDLILLSCTLHVLTALIPLSPFQTSKHLPDLFEGFTRTATLKSVLVKLPQELFLGLDMAVFYFFLQIYALYPCKFLQYLKARFGPTGEVHVYTQHIASLFNQVQVHPNLITDLPSYETQRTRWSSKEPHDISTLALSLCIDPCLVQSTEHIPNSKLDESNELLKTTPPTHLINELPCDPSVTGQLDDTALNSIWSPLTTLGDVTPRSHTHPPSRMTSSDSFPSSTQTTPLPSINGENKFSYSPTASVEGSTSLHSNTFDQLSHGKGVGLSPGSSGRTSPAKCNTPRSFRHIVSDIFRRSSSMVHEDKEEFTTISPSEIDSNQNSTSLDHTPLTTPSNMSDNSGKTSYYNQITTSVTTPPLITTSLPVEDKPLPHSYSSSDILFKARERLHSLQQAPSTERLQTHTNSFLSSYESLSTLTSYDGCTDNERKPLLLIKRSVDNTDNSLANDDISMTSHACISPASMLDQYIQSGNILHSGYIRDVPLPDLPGTQWDHYGGCPHSEELKIKSGLATVLYSQVLLERYQCQQHAKRNRWLMSKVGTTTKLENEVLALRCRLHQQEELVVSLQTDQQLNMNRQASHVEYEELLSHNSKLSNQNEMLSDEVQRLRDTVRKIKEENKQLTKEVHTLKSVEYDMSIMRNKLNEAPLLHNQIEVMLREQLVSEELYHQQKIALGVLRRETNDTHHLPEAILTEKSVLADKVKTLKQEVARMKALLKENDCTMMAKDKQITDLKNSLEQFQQGSKEKLKIFEQKYQSAKNVNQLLEEKILKLKTHIATSTHRQPAPIPAITVSQ